MNSRITVAYLLGLAACATPGANPHDMSAAQHETVAQRESAEANAHDSRYRPGAATVGVRCPPRGPAAVLLPTWDVCWTSAVNPTAAHQREAEAARQRAADHRAASAELRKAEATACSGLAPDERDNSPFAHPEDIMSVTRLDASTGGGRTSMRLPAGATVAFRAVEGMTAEWLRRLVDCHLARNAALGHVVPEMPNCPLVLKGVQAGVLSTGGGFIVELRSEDPVVAQEIFTRAQRLASTAPAVPAGQP